jgi:hypothetical protein
MKLKLAVGAIFAIAITVFARIGDGRVLSLVPHGCEARGSYLISSLFPIPYSLIAYSGFPEGEPGGLREAACSSMLSCPTQE